MSNPVSPKSTIFPEIYPNLGIPSDDKQLIPMLIKKYTFDINHAHTNGLIRELITIAHEEPLLRTENDEISYIMSLFRTIVESILGPNQKELIPFMINSIQDQIRVVWSSPNGKSHCNFYEAGVLKTIEDTTDQFFYHLQEDLYQINAQQIANFNITPLAFTIFNLEYITPKQKAALAQNILKRAFHHDAAHLAAAISQLDSAFSLFQSIKQEETSSNSKKQDGCQCVIQ
jgi:hypothetical protein